MTSRLAMDDATKGKLLLIPLAFCWGLTWPFLRMSLDEVSPWTARFLGYCIGAAALTVMLHLQGRSFRIPFGRDWIHVIITAMLSVVAFGLFGTFAQLSTATTRVVIINYTMPIWGSMMAWLILGERLNAWSAVGLALCVAGLTVLVYPVAATSVTEPTGLILAFLCSLSWAAGTIYMKAVRIKGDLLAIVMWQIALGVVVFAVGTLLAQGPPTFEPLQPRTWFGIAYAGLFGTAIAYFIWYNIIDKVSTATASLGTLMNPVVGVIGSMIILDERLTLTDSIGFTLVFAASACVLLQPHRHAAAKVQP